MYISAAPRRRGTRTLGAPFSIPFTTAAAGAAAAGAPPWWTAIFPPAAAVYDGQQLYNIIFGQNPTADPVIGTSVANYTGNLSPDQVAQIQQNMNAGIVQAAPGNPALQAAMESQGAADISAASSGSVLPTWVWVAIAAGVGLVAVKVL